MATITQPTELKKGISLQRILAQDAIVTAKICDVTGKQIRIIELGYVPAGNYVESSKAIYWDGRTENGEQVSSGTYFYQIQAGDYTETKKMVILK